VNIVEAMDDPTLFGPWFAGDSWDGWRAILKGAFALRMTPDEQAFFRQVAERVPPKQRVRELWIIAGRRGGKDSIASLIAAYTAALFDQKTAKLRPGERAICTCLATDRDQAKIVLGYTKAYFTELAPLHAMVEDDLANAIALDNSVDLSIGTANYRAPRGRPILLAVLDEVGLWRDETTATPDVETYRALVPGMSTVPDAMLIGISTPYRKAGLLWQKYRDHFGRAGDVLVIKAPSLLLNPTLDPAIIEKALAEDPDAARAEWLAEFRNDVDSFVSADVVDAVVVPGRHELPPLSSIRYAAFIDPAGGSGGDSFTLAITHSEGDCAILDAVREVRPPFSPDQVIDDFAKLLSSYRVQRVRGDRWGGEFPRERLRAKGIGYDIAEKPKAEIYREALPLLNSGRVELLDLPRLKAQFIGLERRTARGCRDSIDHAPGGHDDIANVVAGALLMALDATSKPMIVSDAVIARARDWSTARARRF
jgi:hypothetical protein